MQKTDKSLLDSSLKKTYACMQDHCMTDLDASACRRAVNIAKLRGEFEDSKLFAARSLEVTRKIAAMSPEEKVAERARDLTAAVGRAKASCDAGAKPSCHIQNKLEAALAQLKTRAALRDAKK